MKRKILFGSLARPDLPELPDDYLIDLQLLVLDALERNRPDLFREADDDPALEDAATVSQRKAWLAVYGPHSGLES